MLNSWIVGKSYESLRVRRKRINLFIRFFTTGGQNSYIKPNVDVRCFSCIKKKYF